MLFDGDRDGKMLDRISDGDGVLTPYLLSNTPCLVAVGGTDDCFSTLKSTLTESGSLNELKFSDLFEGGDEVRVPVKNARDDAEMMTLAAFFDRVHQNKDNGIYLKDWHASANLRASLSPPLYSVPLAFADDWFDWFWRRCRGSQDDYRFVYIGGIGSSTHFHHDVVYSYSWSVNLTGAKEWTLHKPPSCDGIEDASTLVVVQGVGEAIFVPSGWHHSVKNVVPSQLQRQREQLQRPAEGIADVVLSVNHNWINGFNIYQVWRFLIRELISVREETWHIKQGTSASKEAPELCMTDAEWTRHCEVLLQANARMGLTDMMELCAGRLLCFMCTAQAVYRSNDDEGGIQIGNRSDDYSESTWARVFCPAVAAGQPQHHTDDIERDAAWHKPTIRIGDLRNITRYWQLNTAPTRMSSDHVPLAPTRVDTATSVASRKPDDTISTAQFGAASVVTIVDEMLACPHMINDVLPYLYPGVDIHSTLSTFRDDLRSYISS